MEQSTGCACQSDAIEGYVDMSLVHRRQSGDSGGEDDMINFCASGDVRRAH